MLRRAAHLLLHRPPPAARLARPLPLPQALGSLLQLRACSSAAAAVDAQPDPAPPAPAPTPAPRAPVVPPPPLRPPSLQPPLHPLPPPPARFAVLELGGTQYKVAVDDVICVEKMKVDVGETIHVNRVLLVGSKDATIIGSPLIKDATVEATVEEQALADKVIVFKKKRRKGYRRWKGHRSALTILRIKDIHLPEALKDAL